MTHLSLVLLFTPTSTLPLKYRTNSHPLQQNLLFTPPQPQFNTSHFKSPPSICKSKKWRNNVSFFQDFLTGGNKERDIQSFKDELYETIAPLDRGAEATPQDQQRVDKIASKLEAMNSVKEPLNSDLLNGKWELLYTTSQSILQTKSLDLVEWISSAKERGWTSKINNLRPKFLRPNGKIYQAINADTLRAQNIETWPFYNQATANLVALNSRKVAVKFDFFKIASLIPIKSPGSGRGELEITYLDQDLRISRGNRGNLFILKMVDPTYIVPV